MIFKSDNQRNPMSPNNDAQRIKENNIKCLESGNWDCTGNVSDADVRSMSANMHNDYSKTCLTRVVGKDGSSNQYVVYMKDGFFWLRMSNTNRQCNIIGKSGVDTNKN